MTNTLSYPLKLSLKTTRILSVVKQGLDSRPRVVTKDVILDTIRQIGLLQLDSINVVARSHYLVLLSRVGSYIPSELDELLYPDRALFEQWAHAACLIPIEDYIYLAPVIIARCTAPMRYGRRKALGENPQDVLDAVLLRIKEEGPLCSKDFVDHRQGAKTWWNRKPARVALDVLFYRGYLAVTRRRNFQCYYDLAERVIPRELLQAPLATIEEFHQWATYRSILCLGVATAQQISDYYRQKLKDVQISIEYLLNNGVLTPVEVEGWTTVAYMASIDRRLVDLIESGEHRPSVTTFLSPFDNLIWDRQRVQDIFHFVYRAEMYTPPAERKYGYYVLPILHKSELIGRMDPKMDRKNKILTVRSIYLEPDTIVTDRLLFDLIKALREFATFHGAKSIDIIHSNPKMLKDALVHRLNMT